MESQYDCDENISWKYFKIQVCFNKKKIMQITWALYMYKGKVVPLQAWSGPKSSRKFRFPVFMTTAQDGGKVVSLTHRPPLPAGNAPGTYFCYSLSRPEGHSAVGRILCR